MLCNCYVTIAVWTSFYNREHLNGFWKAQIIPELQPCDIGRCVEREAEEGGTAFSMDGNGKPELCRPAKASSTLRITLLDSSDNINIFQPVLLCQKQQKTQVETWEINYITQSWSILLHMTETCRHQICCVTARSINTEVFFNELNLIETKSVWMGWCETWGKYLLLIVIPYLHQSNNDFSHNIDSH